MLKNRKKYPQIGKLWKQYKYAIWAGLSMGVFLLVLLGVVLPFWEKHEQLQQEIKLNQNQLQLLENFAQKHADYEVILSGQSKEYEGLRRLLPESLPRQEFISELQLAASSTGIRINAKMLAPEPKKRQVQGGSANKNKLRNNKEEIEVVTAEIEASGSYESIIGFLSKLEEGRISVLEMQHLQADERGRLSLLGIYKQYSMK